MRFGLHALGIGTGARPEIIRAVSGAAEAAGFATLWAGEHVVMVDQPQSRYPYSGDGRIAVPADADWLDPLLALTFAAAGTSRIGLATGILLLPEHNPVLAAKQIATLDVLSGGRLTLGIGVGWSAEEFAALGVPFERRGARTAEYVAALRTLWSQDVATFDGEFTRFSGIRVYPKPARGRRIPVVARRQLRRCPPASGRAGRRLVRLQPDRGRRGRARWRAGCPLPGTGAVRDGADRGRRGHRRHSRRRAPAGARRSDSRSCCSVPRRSRPVTVLPG